MNRAERRREEQSRPKLTPVRRLLLLLWIFAVFLVTYFLFRRVGGRALVFLLIFIPLIFGLLLGLRLLAKIDRAIAEFFGAMPNPSGNREKTAAKSAEPTGSKEDFAAFMGFLKERRAAGQFSRTDLTRWCNTRRMNPDSVCQLGIGKGWFREMGGSLVITSTGDQAVARYFGES